MGKSGSRIPRERIALLIFFVFILASGFFIASYFFLGKQLATTATVLDDVTGNMQDYSLLVFAGIDDVGKSDKREAQASAGDDAYSVGMGQQSAIVLKKTLADAYRMANVREDSWKTRIFVSDVRNSYELKGADVATIDLSDLTRYSEPVILDAGRKQFGIFSIGQYISRAKLKVKVDSLRSLGADSVICIAKDASMMPSFNGIDALISINGSEEGQFDQSMGSTLLIEPPSSGTVGMIMFSNANATSYKTITSL